MRAVMPGLVVSAFLLVVFGAEATEAQPGRLPATKKLIEYGWDVPTPEFTAANLATMEKRPFDGLIMRVAGGRRGNIFTGGRWDEATFAGDLAALSSIQWGKFQHNFLMMYSASEMDWFSDSDWEAVLHNVDIMAKLAKAGRCYLAFDAEPYGQNPWSYTQQPQAQTHSFAEYQAMVRERGRQFIMTIERHLPDNVLLTFFTYSIFAGIMPETSPERQQEKLQQHSYGLYHSFLAGILDRLGPRMTVTDGNEPSYYYENSEKYYEAYNLMRQQALSLVPPEDVVRFQTRTQASQALYVDYVFARVPWPNIPALYMSPEEQARWFQHNVYWALKTTDEYVWLYSEKMNWWTDTDLPPGLEEAVSQARELVAANRSPGFDQRDLMKALEERRAAEVREKLIRREAQIPALSGPPPLIDGHLDDPAWQQAALLSPFVGYFGTTEDQVTVTTEARVMWDSDHLYVAVQAPEPQPEKMHITGHNRDDAVWEGESVDLFITTEAAGTPYFHFIINPGNVLWDAFCDLEHDLGFNPVYQSATAVGPAGWTVELAVPWEALQIKPAAGLQLRANLCRQRSGTVKELSCWSQTVKGFLEPQHFGRWELQ
jgi:hypothetical protein